MSLTTPTPAPRRRLRAAVAAAVVAASLLSGAVALPASAASPTAVASSSAGASAHLAPGGGMRTAAASVGYASFCFKTSFRGATGVYDRNYFVDIWNGRTWVAWQYLKAGANGCDYLPLWTGYQYRLRVNHWEAGKNWSGVSGWFSVPANGRFDLATTWVY